MREWVTDFVTAAVAYLSAKKCDEGRRGIKNCLKLCDTIYLDWRRSPEKLLNGLVDAFGHVVVVVDQVEAMQSVKA